MLCPDPLGSLSAPQVPCRNQGGPTSKGREGRERKGRGREEGKGTGGEEKGGETGNEGKGCDPLILSCGSASANSAATVLLYWLVLGQVMIYLVSNYLLIWAVENVIIKFWNKVILSWIYHQQTTIISFSRERSLFKTLSDCVSLWQMFTH